MAIVRRTLSEITAAEPDIDQAMIGATTEEDIRRHMIEDGQDPGAHTDFASWREVLPAREIRRRLGLTQEQFAEALRIPVATLRNWEQGRATPDPAVRSLLTIVAKMPDEAFKALAE